LKRNIPILARITTGPLSGWNPKAARHADRAGPLWRTLFGSWSGGAPRSRARSARTPGSMPSARWRRSGETAVPERRLTGCPANVPLIALVERRTSSFHAPGQPRSGSDPGTTCAALRAGKPGLGSRTRGGCAGLRTCHTARDFLPGKDHKPAPPPGPLRRWATTAFAQKSAQGIRKAPGAQPGPGIRRSPPWASPTPAVAGARARAARAPGWPPAATAGGLTLLRRWASNRPGAEIRSH